MSNRLETIISYVDEGIGVADVGTDHAYLPLMLVKRGYKGNIIATDINEGPLNKALVNLRESYAEDKVKLILCDGLSGCDPDDIDTVVIAGMGGDTITGILDRTPWCDREGIKLVLQPVTKSEILRYWLINNGFIITDESLCEENTTVYQILCAKAGKPCRYSDSEIFVGKFEQIKEEKYEKYCNIASSICP